MPATPPRNVTAAALVLACLAATEPTQISKHWLEGSPNERKRLREIEGAEHPEVAVAEWINGKVKAEDFKGKVVVLDFWATWCKPCVAAIPHNNRLAEKYKGQGLVFIGVCDKDGWERMSQVAEKEGIKYPVAADKEGKTAKAFKVNGYPDYYLIDRSGKLRIADCDNVAVEDAIKALLAEPEPGGVGEEVSR